jgi:hypothetical protein
MPFDTAALVAMPLPEPSDALEMPPPIDGRVHALLLELAALQAANARLRAQIAALDRRT